MLTLACLQVAWNDADGGESESAISAWEVHAAERTAAEVVAPLKGDARAVERATRRLEAACLAVMSVVRPPKNVVRDASETPTV